MTDYEDVHTLDGDRAADHRSGHSADRVWCRRGRSDSVTVQSNTEG